MYNMPYYFFVMICKNIKYAEIHFLMRSLYIVCLFYILAVKLRFYALLFQASSANFLMFALFSILRLT